MEKSGELVHCHAHGCTANCVSGKNVCELIVCLRPLRSRSPLIKEEPSKALRRYKNSTVRPGSSLPRLNQSLNVLVRTCRYVNMQ